MTPSPTPTQADPHAATVWHRASACFDIDAFAAAQSDWSLRYEQLSAGRFASRLQHVQLPGLRLVHERASCATHQRGMLGSGRIGMAMALNLTGHAAFSGQALTRVSIMLGPTEHLDLSVPADYGLIGAVVDRDLLSCGWAALHRQALPACQASFKTRRPCCVCVMPC